MFGGRFETGVFEVNFPNFAKQFQSKQRIASFKLGTLYIF